VRHAAAADELPRLAIDWRRGECYFAQQLNDYDLAANNGGWQWAASSGCDAQPYFRIFNPVSQSRKFDPEGKFITHYLPAVGRPANSRAARAPGRGCAGTGSGRRREWSASPADQASTGMLQ